MKRFTQIATTILLAFIFSLSAFGQGRWYEDQTHLNVMAPSGLSLRAEADVSGKRVMVIPFGKQVKHHGKVGQLVKIGGVEGFWRKITYKGKTGYSFGPYLNPLKQLKSTDMNREVRLDYGSHCTGDVNYDPRLHWYGFEWDWESGKGKMTAIKPELLLYGMGMDEMLELSDYWLQDSSLERGSRFMIGSKVRLEERKEIKDFSPIEYTDLSMQDTSIQLDQLKLSIELHEVDAELVRKNPWEMGEKETPYFSLKVTYQGKSQKLDLHKMKEYLNPQDRKYYWSSIILEFAGDLDGDNIPDLLFRAGRGEGGGSAYLYLSRYAEPGKILKRVASREGGYCC
ncbi:MAG: SH3 domain-containing protein [Bacteroidia bacterium]|nr:SH3 domain-containing protein [Bacteroidia bacterium]